MLEPVALNQTRFNAPGVAPDNRGILLGKQGALLFASVDRLVGFFRVFCDESSIDDILPKLKIHQVRTPLESRELLVLFHATTSYLLDRASRIASLFGGLAFTGSGKHFVKYRDGQSPLGYDLAQLSADPSDFVLYADTFTQGYQRVRDVPFEQLVFRLSLRRLPGVRTGEGAADAAIGERRDREVLWLVVQPGLFRSVLGYLFRNRVRAETAGAVPSVAGQGGTFAEKRALHLVRVHELPDRMLALFSQVPGIEVHHPVSENVIVELGWRHPLRLESCAAIFEKDRFYVFSGGRDAVDVLVQLPPLAPVGDLIGVGFDLGERPEPRELQPQKTDSLGLELTLVPSTAPDARRRVTATLVEWRHAAWLKRLVYALPPTLLGTYKVAAVPEGLFIVGEHGIDGLPLGTLYQEAAPSVYVPLGHEFLPRVSPQVLTELVGGVAGRVVVFVAGAKAPLALEQSLFESLGRRALARLPAEARERDERLAPPRAATPATVVNEDAPAFPLWSWHKDAP